MGYLDNSSRILDAILTKKGREILSSGGDFSVTKFALGDDEIDYSLWDTTHTNGTDYYGAVIDNLPALEPFNDPSEIMKYKLVTRSDATEAMAKLEDQGNTSGNMSGLKWYANSGEGNSNRVSILPAAPNNFTGMWPKGELSGGNNGSGNFNIGHISNFQDGNKDHASLAGETYTVTLLDSSVACLAPEFELDVSDVFQGGAGAFQGGAPNTAPTKIINAQGSPNGGMSGSDFFWMPFVDNVQHISQTMSGLVKSGNNLTIPNDGRDLLIYGKKISATATTSVLIMGELSGATIEFDVTITKS
jgi:hypothetical protein|tara:strand:- start:191 stop:1099 length:909 start_codon:yes stop_codon:yes gene_type:complete